MVVQRRLFTRGRARAPEALMAVHPLRKREDRVRLSTGALVTSSARGGCWLPARPHKPGLTLVQFQPPQQLPGLTALGAGLVAQPARFDSATRLFLDG